MAKTTVRGAQIADGANGVDLTVDVTGVLPVANGGTGSSVMDFATSPIPSIGGNPILTTLDVPILASGTWTPTLANVSNTSARSTNLWHYIRVGDEVSFSGTVTITASGSGSTIASITVPIPSTLGSTTDDAAGVATTQQAITNGAFIRADGSGKLVIAFTASGAGAVSFRVSGHYIIN